MKLLFTCEHASDRVPARYRDLIPPRVLRTHRAVDFGALLMARALARHFGAPLVVGEVTRLLVELNRSRHRAFSEFVPSATRQAVLARYYDPHHARVRDLVASQRPVIHIGVHSFTPVWHGEERRCDVGLLFDPRRRREATLSRAWQAALKARRPDLVIRRNYPYLGTSDGLTTLLRKQYGDARYAGIEIEVNQKFALNDQAGFRRIVGDITATLGEVLA